jgi:hypothetical protein
MKKKLFISHATEDKKDFVHPLAESLSADFEVWYDDYKLVIGCSLLEEISKGLAKCDFGVVILSNHFFAKNWPQQELNGLFALEEKDKKVILPVWKNITREDVLRYSPILADRFAAKAKDGIDNVVNEIKRAVAFFERGRSVERPTPGFNKLLSSIEKKAERERSVRIVWSNAGISIAMETARQTIHILSEQIRCLSEHTSFNGVRIDGPKDLGIGCTIKIWIAEICLEVYYVNNVVNSARDARLEVVIFQAKVDYWERSSQPKVYEKESYSLYIDRNDNRLWEGKKEQMFTPEQLVDAWLEKLSARIENK